MNSHKHGIAVTDQLKGCSTRTKEGNSKGGENDGRLLIGFYYSAVTGNRKQVLTGSSESCEHKCR